jgi:hypothetical protein
MSEDEDDERESESEDASENEVMIDNEEERLSDGWITD